MSFQIRGICGLDSADVTLDPFSFCLYVFMYPLHVAFQQIRRAQHSWAGGDGASERHATFFDMLCVVRHLDVGLPTLNAIVQDVLACDRLRPLFQLLKQIIDALWNWCLVDCRRLWSRTIITLCWFMSLIWRNWNLIPIFIWKWFYSPKRAPSFRRNKSVGVWTGSSQGGSQPGVPPDQGGWGAPLVGQVAGGDGTSDTVTNNKIISKV